MEPPLTFFASVEDSQDKWVVEILDQCGIAYRTVNSKAPAAPRLECGPDVLTRFNRPELLEFLWAHGAKLEDS